MPIFEYTAITANGRRSTGTIDADSPSDARRKLRESRVHIASIGEKSGGESSASTSRRSIGRRRIRQKDVASAIRQLATLLHAGMALVPALSALVEQLGGDPLADAMAQVRDDVESGSSLAAALAEHPSVFPDLFASMVAAGESAGALEAVLGRLAEMTEKRIKLIARVRGAMVYPLFMSVVGVGAVLFLLAYAVPSIGKLFLEMNRNLPAPTTALIAVSNFTRDYLWLIVLGGVVGWFGLRAYIATASGRLRWDALKLKLPLFGTLILRMAISRFARTLGVLLASGVSILDALENVKRVVGNVVLARAIEEIREEVKRGAGISGPMRKSKLFPPIVIHMIATGETSGNIEESLLNVADAYDEEVETSVGALTSLLEPLMIIVMGAVVGFVVLAVLLPIFEINQAIR